MADRTLPNVGLTGFWNLGEDGWKDHNDLNLLKLSVLVQGGAVNKVSVTPGSPADGDVHIFSETHPTQANAIAIRDAGAWVYISPLPGWLIYNRAAGYYEKGDIQLRIMHTMDAVVRHPKAFVVADDMGI